MLAYVWASGAAAFVLWLQVRFHLFNGILYEGYDTGEGELIAAAVLMLVLFIAHGFVSAGRLELRQRGLIISGIWFPWRSIESYAWQDAGSGFVSLRVQSRRWLRFVSLASLEIALPAQQKNQTDTILKNQLSEWPGAPAAA